MKFRTLSKLAASLTMAAAMLGLFISPAAAMRVSPMVVEMASRGSASVARVEVQNINAGKLAFETRVFRMELNENGDMIETPADEDFLVFPPQGVLPTGGRQVVRLQWVGNGEIATSQAYYVSVQQIPVALEPGAEDELSAQVQVLYNMRALVVVAPPGAKPDVSSSFAQVERVQAPVSADSGEEAAMLEGVRIVLSNEGRRHAMMSNFTWKLEGTDPEGKWLRVDVKPEELAEAIGTGYVPAMGERTFMLPIAGFGPDPIKVEFVQ